MIANLCEDFFHENDLHQVYIFFHNLVTYDSYVRNNYNILIFLKTFELDFDKSLQKMIFQKNAPIPSLYFLW